MIRVAAQIGLPGRIPLGPGEGGGQTDGGGQNTVWVIEVVGHSIDDALMNLQQQISGRLFFGHLRVIVVSEAVAKKGWKPKRLLPQKFGSTANGVAGNL